VPHAVATAACQVSDVTRHCYTVSRTVIGFAPGVSVAVCVN
jgi:hypothetical protein